MAKDKLVPELYCTNLERSLAFYVGDLGFTVRFFRPEEGFAYLDRGDIEVMIEQLGVAREWITGEMIQPFGRGVNFQIPVNDVLALYNSLKEKGYSFFLPLEEKWYRQKELFSGCRQFIIQDPDGYLLRFGESLGLRAAPP